MSTRKLSVWLAAGVLAVSVAACSADDSDGSETTSPSVEATTSGPEDSPEAGETDGGDPGGTSEITDGFGSVDGYEGALDDVTVARCEGTDDGVQVAGTVQNSAGETRSYRIYVSVMSDGDTLAIKQVDVPDVGADAAADWETLVIANGDPIECVLRVERFAPLG